MPIDSMNRSRPISLSLSIALCASLIGCKDENSRTLDALFFNDDDDLCLSLNPSPANGATDQPIDLQLQWSCEILTVESVDYSLYFGTSNPPPLVASGLAVLQYEVAGLERGRQYFWKVTVTDIYGVVQEGQVWTFFTTGNEPPTVPSNPTPANGSVIRDLKVFLEWDAIDPDSGLVDYTIYVVDTDSTSIRGTLRSSAAHHQYYMSNLRFDRSYDWRVEAEDDIGQVTGGPTWRFSLPYMGQIVYEWNGRQIYKAQADGTMQTQLTQLGSFGAAGNPDWSPDFSRIVYDAYLDYQTDTAGIWVMNRDGSGQTRLTRHSGKDEAPSWSPDGSRIAFHRRSPGETTTDIWVMNSNGTNQINLTSSLPVIESDPDWSSDGTRICFSARPDSTYSRDDLWVMNSDGSSQTNLTNSSGNWDGLASWSPDGQKIAYGSSRQNDYQIVIMNADGSGAVVLTSGTADNHAPAWSPDGTMIVYCSGSPYYDIYLMHADGSGSVRVVNEPPNSGYKSYFVPSWGFPPK